MAYADDARKEVAVARWLTEETSQLLVRSSSISPSSVDGRVVTFWKSISDKEDYGTPIEVGRLLSRLHAMEAPTDLRLPPLRPFARAERRIAENDWFSPEDSAFMRAQLVKLQEDYAALAFG
ncbi:hypothetical protein ACFYY8_05365 [Streptosporangium sp. NPDC001559]|uniref:hypothetical protein n=1 Tax=Streptosporangium sp. NPDC001559 TaxID=3366187 RepID=UPI0036E3363B